MKEADLINWLKAQKETLDRIIAQAGEDFHNDNKGRSNFSFDLAQCQAESYYLSQNPPQDLCYDRPNTPLTYSLWYHGRRVNTFLSRYARTFFSNTDDVLEVFELGHAHAIFLHEMIHKTNGPLNCAGSCTKIKNF